METAIELLQHFVKTTEMICEELSVLADFSCSHSISASTDSHTLSIYKISELHKIHGFFTANAVLASGLITFVIDYGGIDYSIHAYIRLNGQHYSYSAYQHSTMGVTSKIAPNVKSSSQIDKLADEFIAFIMESYPIFKKNPKLHTRHIAKFTKHKYKKEAEELKKLEAQSSIRKACILYMQQDYINAYKLYRQNRKYLSEEDIKKMKKCKKG